MNNESNDDQLKRETRTGIRRVGDARKKVATLEQMGVPEQIEEYQDLRDEVEILLDQLLVEEKLDLETSHLIRNKLQRINILFEEMGQEGHFSKDGDTAKDQLDYDKEKQDSKLEIVQLMLSQIFPKLKQGMQKGA